MSVQGNPQRLALLHYRLLFIALTPLIIVYTVWQAVRQRAWRYLRERFGFYRNKLVQRPVWLHAASVGELNAALPLINALRAQHPQRPLLVTTSTVSSAALAAKHLPAEITHAFLPLDGCMAVERFLRQFQPQCALIMETELWPNLFAACQAHDIPLIVVNGRLSVRTLNAPAWLRRQYRCALNRVDAVLARSESDKTAFLALGTPAERVQVIGNIKFSVDISGTTTPVSLPRSYVLAASTRDGEEQLILEAWQRSNRAGRLLVIVPRHPQRREDILRSLALSREQVAVRSANETITQETRVYLADTFGELTGFMTGAELVFMGGSLVAKGGQNVLEPAALGKAIVFGPHMDNFADEARLLLEHEAAEQVADVAALDRALTRLLAEPQQRNVLGKNARRVVEERRDMVQRYLTALAPFCAR